MESECLQNQSNAGVLNTTLIVFFRNYYYPPEAYNNSKLAQVLFTKQLQKQLTEDQSRVQIHAVHPGVVDTELFNQTGASLIPWFNRIFFKVTMCKYL